MKRSWRQPAFLQTERTMKSLLLLAGVFTVGLAALCIRTGTAKDSTETVAQTPANVQTQTIVAAATAFLDSLSPEQLGKVRFPFAPQETATLARFRRTGGGPGGPGGPSGGPGDQGPPPGPHRDHDDDRPHDRDAGPGGGPGKGPSMGPFGGFVGEQYGQAVWSNYPVSDVPRPGLQLGSLSDAQRDAAMRLLQVLLSSKGYQKVLDTMGSDQVLSEGETHYAAGTKVYTLGLFGTPSASAPWMVQFGGHHLGLNVVIAGEHGVMTPTLTGAQPAVYTANGKTVRALAQENDKAFDLLHALDDDQRKQAVLNYRVGDLVLGPGAAGKTIVPEGLKASAMNEAQRAMLLNLITEWSGILNDAHAAARLSEIKDGLDETYFAWSGPTTHEEGKNGAAYYRIQGPKLVIEFSPQGVGGDPTMHIHTMYRDPTNDYGRAFLFNAK